MNRILTYGLATVLATAFTPTVFADKDGHGGHGGGGGGHGGGGAPARVSAPHMSAPARASAPAHFSAPRVSMSHSNGNMRAPSAAPRIAPQAQVRSAPIARTQPSNNFRSSVAHSQRNNSPSIAFGGHVIDNNNQAAVNTQTRRSFANGSTQQLTTRRGDGRDFRVPSETSRNWDHGRTHEWNHHHYRFSGGSWVIIDPGIYDYGYGYGYPDDYGVTTYSAPAYDSGSLVMSAQDRLNRLGYSAGPADGVMGPQTRDAIADFQNDNNLPASGGLDTATVQALGL